MRPEAMDAFIDVLDVIKGGDRAGPSFLQLPPWFDASRIGELDAFCRSLPTRHQWAVEVRHDSWFDEGPNEQSLCELLTANRMDRVIFDSRALFQAPPSDEIETVSQKRKPNPPVRFQRTGLFPIVRFVGRNQVELADPFVQPWIAVLQKWLAEGCQPFFFTHAPSDQLAPRFARRVAEKYGQDTRNHPFELPWPPQRPKQLTLL